MITPPPSKLPNLPPSIFAVMNRLSAEHNAINLAQGFPDFPTDPLLIDYIAEAMREGHNQYAPFTGLPALKDIIASKIETLYGASYNPDNEITITVGATQAIYSAITALVHPGDEVIIFKPAYDCYEPDIRAAGGKVVPLQMEGKEYGINWERFREALSPKTRMVVINSPHNPSGTVLEENDYLELERSLKGTDVLVLSDEAYEHLVFDGRPLQSIAKYDGLRERGIVCASFGKTFHATGWKIGYSAAPAQLSREIRKIHEFAVYAVHHPTQRGLTRYLEDPKTYLGLPEFFQRKRDLFLEALSGSRFTITPCQGTYFQTLGFENITDEADVDFAARLAKEAGVAAIPISVFNMHKADYHQLRFCFAKKDETLLKAAEILSKV